MSDGDETVTSNTNTSSEVEKYDDNNQTENYNVSTQNQTSVERNTNQPSIQNNIHCKLKANLTLENSLSRHKFPL